MPSLLISMPKPCNLLWLFLPNTFHTTSIQNTICNNNKMSQKEFKFLKYFIFYITSELKRNNFI